MARRRRSGPRRTTDLSGILFVDGGELRALEARLNTLTDRMQERVIRRSYATVMRRMEVDVTDAIVAGTDMRRGVVRRKVRAYNQGGAVLVKVRSPWIPLIDLGRARAYGPRRNRNAAGQFSGGANRSGGVDVAGWGKHAGAFIATVKAGKSKGHRGIFARKGVARNPIKELWGPNPAQHVVTHADQYSDILQRISRTELLPEIERQINLALSGL